MVNILNVVLVIIQTQPAHNVRRTIRLQIRAQ